MNRLLVIEEKVKGQNFGSTGVTYMKMDGAQSQSYCCDFGKLL